MPVYQFTCPYHGLREVSRPMAEAGEPAHCDHVDYADDGPAIDYCGEPMKRIYTGSGIIMRPDGWSLRPGDKGYWNFNRQQELHQLRDGEAGDKKRLDQSLYARPAPPKIEYSDKQMREIRNFSEIVDREIRASSDIPELWREGS
jgi:hypothetical protein